jgi:hypothetical protein
VQIKIAQDAAARFLKENAATVLTAGGVVGTVGTAVLAFRAGVKYERITHEMYDDNINPDSDSVTTFDKVKAAAPYVIPPIALGTATVGSIIGANVMSAKRAAALAAAYGVSQKQLDEYKTKMAEKLGVTKTEKAKAEMAKERADQVPGASTIVIFGDEVLCFDEPTGRYFKSTMEKIRRAENSTNQEIIHHGYASASYFYSELELPGTTWADEVGWNDPFSLEISTIMVEDKPCLAIDFKKMPVLDYERGGGRYR